MTLLSYRSAHPCGRGEERVDIGRNQPLEVAFPLRERGWEQWNGSMEY